MEWMVTYGSASTVRTLISNCTWSNFQLWPFDFLKKISARFQYNPFLEMPKLFVYILYKRLNKMNQE